MSNEAKYPSQMAERFQVRLPDGLRDRIRESAARNNRSMNAEIIYRIEESLSRDSWLDELATDSPNSGDDPMADARNERGAYLAALQLKPEDMTFDDFAEVMERTLENSYRRAAKEAIAILQKTVAQKKGERDREE